MSKLISSEFTIEKCRSLQNYYQKYLKEININQKSVTLDVGCGFGFLSPSFDVYIGTDIDAHKINFAQKMYGDKGFNEDDITIANSNFLNKFDLIICFTVFDEISIDLKKECLINMGSYLDDNGRILFEVRNKSFIIRSLIKFLGLSFIHKNKLKEKGLEDMDMSLNDYTNLFEKNGFTVKKIYKAKRSLHSSNTTEFLKKVIYRCLDTIVPLKYCFMIGFDLERN